MLVRNLLQATIAIVALILTGCQTTTSNSKVLAAAKPRVVASHSVLCHFLGTIAEDTIDLTCLMDGGQDPHTYRPTPSQRKALEKAQLIFYGGYELEPQVISLIEAVDEKTPKIAVYEAVVTDPIMTEHHHSEEATITEHHHQEEATEKAELEPDPHIWHDTYNAVATIEYLQSLLLQLNPDRAVLYLENSAKLTEELRQLHVWIQEQIATIPEGQRILVTTHDSLNYYVKAYELEDYKTLQGLSPDDSPSASDLKELVREIQQTRVPTIFAEATTNNRVIKSISREANVKVSKQELLVDGLGEANTNTDTYTKMMISNTCAIVDGLGGNCQPFKN